MENYVDWTLATLINTLHLEFKDYATTFSSVLTLLFLAAILLSPVATFWFLKTNYPVLHYQSYKGRYGSLYGHFEKQEISAYKHQVYFFVRRWLMAFILIFFRKDFYF